MAIDSANQTPADAAPATTRDGADRFTLARMMLLVAGITVGLVIFGPQPEEFDSKDHEWWRGLATAVLIGAAIPGPIMVLRSRRPRRRLASGSLFLLMCGLGIWLLLPPAVAARTTSADTMAIGCLYYTQPQKGLWFFLAAAITGHAQRAWFRQHAAWTDRFGTLLAALWSPLGAWHVVDFYIDAFS
jgi:hypothetical protein